MSDLLDTNILSHVAQPANPRHSTSLAALDALADQGEDLVIVPQNLYEFWVVCTRPASVNGFGFDPARARAELAKAKSLFRLIPDSADVFNQWEQLVSRIEVRGKTAHDARLVAAMAAHGITHLLTFNVADFRRYPGITVVNPEELTTPPSGQP